MSVLGQGVGNGHLRLGTGKRRSKTTEGDRKADNPNTPDAARNTSPVGYARLLLTRWSRRDRLAVVLVALTAVFLVGASLMLVATTETIDRQIAAFDADATVEYHTDDRDPDVPSEALVLPVAEVTIDDTSTTVVGVPPAAAGPVEGGSLPWLSPARLPVPPPEGTVLGPVENTTTRRLTGDRATLDATVRPTRTRSILPPTWYVANVSAVDRFGRSATIVVRPDAGRDTTVPAEGVTLLSAVAYLLGGARGLVAALWLVTAGSGLLVAVTLYSVTRTTVRDRRRTVFVARATGARPRRVVVLLAARTGVIAAVGVLAGALAGVGVARLAIELARRLGVTTTLSAQVTGAAVGVLAPALASLVVVGVLAGALAAWAAVGVAPATLTDASTGRRHLGSPDGPVGKHTTLRVLDWRALAPTTGALTVFATVVLLTVGVAGALGPLVAPAGGTVVETGAPHPLASQVDRDTVSVLRAQGIPASPEIYVPQVRDGDPYLVRGAEFEAYANLTNATLVRGRPPDGPREAVVGVDLATTIGVGVGDSLTLGGGTRPGVDRVRVVGAYRAPGFHDDQLVVPLTTATHLTPLDRGTVNVVRVRGLKPLDDPSNGGDTDEDEDGNGDSTATAPGNRSVVVTGLSVPERATVEEGVTVAATVRNYGTDRFRYNATVSAGDVSRTVPLAVPPGAERTATVTLPLDDPGTYTVVVGVFTETVTIVDGSGLRLGALPRRAPPNATFLASVTENGEPTDAVVGVGNRTARTNASGVAELRFPARPDEYTVSVRAGDRVGPTRSVTVSSGAARRLVFDLDVRPSSVTPGTRPRATVRATNPWPRPVERVVTVTDGAVTRTRTVTVPPGGRSTAGVRLPAPRENGTRTVTARVDGIDRARATYRVTSDARAVAAVARSGGYDDGSALGRGIEGLVGNLEVLQATLVALATLMVLGGTVAGFAQAVAARRRAIGVYRVTGATPTRLLLHATVDAARVGVVAAVFALSVSVGGLLVLDAVDALTFFGVRLRAIPPWPHLLAVAAGGTGLAVVSGVVATAGSVLGPPGRFLRARPVTRRPPTEANENRDG